MVKKLTIGGVLLIGAIFALFYFSLSAPGSSAETERFVVPQGTSSADAFAELSANGFVRSGFAFGALAGLRGVAIPSGAYKLAKNMNAFQVADTLAAGPYMKWIVVPEGMRKEEIADQLSAALGWNDEKKAQFLNAYETLGGSDYREGVYFPDTYLLPKDEDGAQIAQRFIQHFNEKFALYAAEAARQNVKWTTALKIASLIQREAAGTADMPIISGVIWNRLLQGMKLDIDATVEYARGNKGEGYWAPLHAGDTAKFDSPYNTYLYKGLPPTPIANPGLAAMNAALHEASTTCLYYLHDASGQIHCSDTYAEHEANVERYLK